MNKIIIVWSLSVLFAFQLRAEKSAEEIRASLTDIEELTLYGMEPQDDFVHNPEPPYVPLRFRNSYVEYRDFANRMGWTTNQFINGLIFAFTNNLTDVVMNDSFLSSIPIRAVIALGDIPDPAVTNYFRSVMDRDDMRGLQRLMVVPMFQYTNLEPEVLDYMKSLCVKTNIYKEASYSVARYMYETLNTMPDEMKPAATNRVANFMYYSICHSIGDIVWQDEELARFLPMYSNSIQRFNAMQYVAATTTNNFVRPRAQAEVDRLLQLGTNNLADVSWLEE